MYYQVLKIKKLLKRISCLNHDVGAENVGGEENPKHVVNEESSEQQRGDLEAG